MKTLTESELRDIDGGFAPLSGGTPPVYPKPIDGAWWEFWLRNAAN